jgi:diguanylate cyclase (GGDEF)-like protein
MDYSKIPDLLAIALLTCAFASVARRNNHPGAGLWLLGWSMIELHLVAQMFMALPGWFGQLALFLALSSLLWAGTLFIRATVPRHHEPENQRIHWACLLANTFYLAILLYLPSLTWLRTVAAALIALLPLAAALPLLHQRWQGEHRLFLAEKFSLSIFLLVTQFLHMANDSMDLNALLFSTFFSCGLYFWISYRKATAGVFITITGFMAWASVFILCPCQQRYFPHVSIEHEVWNLPKYIVAAGMILLLLERQIEHNEFLALHDDLTGLPNRRLFQDRIHNALARARRNDRHMALLLIDLNRFKQVNDQLGHHMGDLVLKEIAQIFLHRMRRSDTVARTGGDEFAVILEEPISRVDAELVAHALVELLDQPIHLGVHTIHTGASIGVAMFPEDASTAETLGIAADQRMYATKPSKRQAEHAAPSLVHVSAALPPEALLRF